jgi:sigma-B regulation protein RsbU (phosphoserine phosphatase)
VPSEITSIASVELLREENQRLKRAVEELSVLNDLSRAIGASLNSEEIMNTIVRRSLRAVNAEQGVITLVDEQQSDTQMKTLVRAVVSSSQHEQFHLNQALIGWMHLNKKPLIVNNTKTDERFRGVLWDTSVNNLVCVPLMVKSALRGVLTVYNKKGGESFPDDDQRLLSIIAAQSAQVIENARLYEQEKAFMHMQEEVRLAAKIQMELLPKESPAVSGYDIAGRTIPAQAVGGDYFDFIPIDDHRMAICLGDVSGKGLPASLLMANTQATLRAQAKNNLSASEWIARSNTLLNQSTSSEKFVTLFFGILDFTNHTFTFSNAGHDNPFFFSTSGEPRRLSTGGIVLAMMETFDYEEQTISFHPGDTLLMYSDGVTETFNEQEEEFGDGRIGAYLANHWIKPANELIDGLVSVAKSFGGSSPQRDDITIVVIKRISS